MNIKKILDEILDKINNLDKNFQDYKNKKDSKELKEHKKITSDFVIDLNNCRKENKMLKRDIKNIIKRRKNVY